MSEVFQEIQAWHRKRNFAMDVRKKSDLALGANIRTWLGWRKDLPEDQRKTIADQAADLIKCGEVIAKGKPHDLATSKLWEDFGDTVSMSIASRSHSSAFEAVATKNLERLAMSLPIWENFAKDIRGFGAVSVGVVIGEAGDLANYSTHSKLWKRMGLAVMDGVRQGGLAKGAGAEAWIAHGYNPKRRSTMHVIGDVLMKVNKDGRYRTTYDTRKAYERERAAACGLVVMPAAKIPAKDKDRYISDGQIHLRSLRYMEKRLLRDMWQAWT